MFRKNFVGKIFVEKVGELGPDTLERRRDDGVGRVTEADRVGGDEDRTRDHLRDPGHCVGQLVEVAFTSTVAEAQAEFSEHLCQSKISP